MLHIHFDSSLILNACNVILSFPTNIMHAQYMYTHIQYISRMKLLNVLAQQKLINIHSKCYKLRSRKPPTIFEIIMIWKVIKKSCKPKPIYIFL